MSQIICRIQEIATDTLMSDYAFKANYMLVQKYEELLTHLALQENPEEGGITVSMWKKAHPYFFEAWKELIEKLWAQAVESRDGFIPSESLSLIQTALGFQTEPDATVVEQVRQMEYYELKYFILLADQDEEETGVVMAKWQYWMPREFAKWSNLRSELFQTLGINQQ
jgi:hypothetical protein